MRAIILTVVGLLFIILIPAIYNWFTATTRLADLDPALKLIGVIDMNVSHAISIKGIQQGDDVILVLDYPGFLNNFMPQHPEFKSAYSKPFDLANYDIHQSGVIDTQHPLWKYLFVVTYSEDGATYNVRRLYPAGIRAILTSHLKAQGNHGVLLSDGNRRTLYEVSPFETPPP